MPDSLQIVIIALAFIAIGIAFIDAKRKADGEYCKQHGHRWTIERDASGYWCTRCGRTVAR